MVGFPVFRTRRFVTSGIAVLTTVALVILLGALLAGRRDAITVKRMCSVGAALAVYEMIHGTLPPAYVADADGKPAHSWRVLLLPLLGYEDIFQKYDFSEPWNSPHNRSLLSEIPIQYQAANGPEGYTDVVAVVGKKTAWPGRSGMNLEDVNVSNLVILVQSREPREWLAPEDISYSAMISSLKDAEGLNALLGEKAYCVTADRVVHRLRSDITAAELDHILTVQHGSQAAITRDVLVW